MIKLGAKWEMSLHGTSGSLHSYPIQHVTNCFHQQPRDLSYWCKELPWEDTALWKSIYSIIDYHEVTLLEEISSNERQRDMRIIEAKSGGGDSMAKQRLNGIIDRDQSGDHIGKGNIRIDAYVDPRELQIVRTPSRYDF